VICRACHQDKSPLPEDSRHEAGFCRSRRSVIRIRGVGDRELVIHDPRQQQPSGGSMFFVVTGNGRNGTVAVTCDSAASALEKAHQLDADGVTDLLITDADGLQHAPGEFDRLYVAQAP
jgi:hypothetical protein